MIEHQYLFPLTLLSVMHLILLLFIPYLCFIFVFLNVNDCCHSEYWGSLSTCASVLAGCNSLVVADCYCGIPNHSPKECKFKDANCHFCGKKGHIAPACRVKLQKKVQGPNRPAQSRRTNTVLKEEGQSDHEEFYSLNKFSSLGTNPINIFVQIFNPYSNTVSYNTL